MGNLLSKAVLMVGAVTLMGWAAWATHDTRFATKAEYEAVTNGMTQTQLEDLVGSKAMEKSGPLYRWKGKGEEMVKPIRIDLTWTNTDGSAMICRLSGGHVYTKAWQISPKQKSWLCKMLRND